MGSLSIWHWLVVAIVIMLLFGKGRISDMMGDLAKGIKSFKKGLADDEDSATPASEKPMISQQTQTGAEPTSAPVEPAAADPKTS